MNITQEYQGYLEKLINALNSLNEDKLKELYKTISRRVGSKKTIFICGNGGSAATASHMACDFSKTSLGVKGRSSKTNLRVISLNDCIPVMTAWANDKEYKHIFSEQLQNLGTKGDLLIIISASGNSQNILEAILTAKKIGIETFGLLGFGGGKAKEVLDEYLQIDSFEYGIVEDVHSIVNHFLTDCLKNSKKD